MEENVGITENVEPTKEELERAKLLLEIEELKKKWWKKTLYIGALFPTVLDLATLIYGFANGYFQASFIKLENQKYDLQKEVEKLNQDKLSLENQKAELEAKNETLSREIERRKRLISIKNNTIST